MPARRAPAPAGQYELYPAFPLDSNKIGIGYDSLAQQFAGGDCVILDGDACVFWANVRAELDAALVRLGVRARWVDVSDARRSEREIEALVTPFLGGNDPLFGTRFTGELRQWFDAEKLDTLRPDREAELNVLYGCGAALAGWAGLLVYFDVPKNEIQYRARAGSVTNLGAGTARDFGQMYKRFYFVDWVVINRHKANLVSRIDLMVDEQRPNEPAWMHGEDLREGLTQMSRNYFRARPWFEPGPWGGDRLKELVPQLAQDAPNYAWSFELIAPENGLLLESDGSLLEVAFDWLMFYAHANVLGRDAARFGFEFPIRFDYLDTFHGGNLSLQCHPRPEYIREHFGENFTQDETYYILDCAPDAQVYLGFREEIEPQAFRRALEESRAQGIPVEIERFVRTAPAHKHDLFLIPNGTVHCSGANNLVLEISATPYIFTFKMYDWLRRDLNGNLRPLNIERAFENLYFERAGERVRDELISRPRVLDGGPGWRLVHMPTHPAHFYDVHRIEFDDSVEVMTGNQCHVMNLVEGEAVLLETENGLCQRFYFGETFVVPAATHSYRLTNEGQGTAKVVKAFCK